MINTIIIDREIEVIHDLKHLLNTHCSNNIWVSGYARSICEGAALVLDTKPGLLFVGTQLNGGSGLQLIKELSQFNTNIEVVFTTSDSEEALRAFKWGVQDYLLKPISKENLLVTVFKAEERINFKYEHTKLVQELENIRKSIQQNKKIAVPTQSGFQVIVVRDIIRCEGVENYTNFHLTDGSCILVCKTLKNYEEILVPNNFFRIHKKNLINLDYVNGYVKGDGGMVIMADHSELGVSRYRKDEFISVFNGRNLI